MNDGKTFKSIKELWSHLVSGGKVRRRYEIFNPKIVFLDDSGNLVTSSGEKVSYIAEFSKWVVHSPEIGVKVIAYKKVENRYPTNDRFRYDRTRYKMKELGIATRDLGQVVFTTEGSPDHEALEESSEFARCPSLDPISVEDLKATSSKCC